MLGGEEAQEIGHQRHVKDGDDADMESAAQLSGFAREFLKATLELPENGAGVLLEDQSRRGQKNAFAAALEQGDAQARLQIAHLLGNARLGNSEPVRRAAEAAGLGHGEEVAQMADFQRIVRHGPRSFCT